MFNWLRPKAKTPPFRHRDRVWQSSEAKWKALPLLVQEHAPVMVLGWFDTTIRQGNDILAAHGLSTRVQHGRQFSAHAASGATVILLEHYPLLATESAILQSEAPSQILVLSALDELLFMHFGGERIKDLMQKLGLQPDEVIEHSMISASIRRAQEKTASQVMVDFSARSPEEWYNRLGA